MEKADNEGRYYLENDSGKVVPLVDLIDGKVPATSKVFDVSTYSGFVGDGSHDDTTAMQRCADECEATGGTYYLPAEKIGKITAQLDLRNIKSVNVQGRILDAYTSGPAVLAGGNSANVFSANIFLNEVVYAGSQSNVGVRIVGVKNANITINRCEYLQLYADAADATMASIAYSQFTLGKVDKIELYGESGVSWINENRFYGGRVSTLIINAVTYSHNHNKFIDNTFENAVITMTVGNSNLVEGARFEGTTPVITFGATTWRNRVVQDWEQNLSVTWVSATVTDSGVGNRVVMRSQEAGMYVPIFRIDAASKTTDQGSAWIVPHATARIRPGFRKLKAPSVAEYVDTGIFPIESVTPAPYAEGGNAMKFLRFCSDVSMWRPRVYVYDSNRVALDGTSTDYISLTGGWVWNASGYYQHGANVGVLAPRIIVIHSSVKFLRVTLLGNSAGGAFTYAELGALVEAPYGTQFVDLIKRQMERPLFKANTTVPTDSLLQAGDSIKTSTGEHQVIFRFDTALSVAAVATNATITLSAVTGIATGDSIAILLDDGTTHFTTVNGAPSGSVVTLTVAMPSAAAIGNNVAALRWAHYT